MEKIKVKDILEATGGRLLTGDENTEITGFSIDSRQGGEHTIFVPIIGERVDAHRFIDSALEINAATFTSEHDEASGDKPWIRVDDTVEAMQKVATYYRNRMKLPVVAVTGSVGKTTTREMIAAVLASGKRVFETSGNQNSQVGVPLTLSRLSPEDEIAVLEIGMSERGQIEKLSRMIRPNIAVVTVIGVSHIAQLGSQENICLEKMDIVKGLSRDGMIFLNGDDKWLAGYHDKLPFKTRFYGLGEDCDYRAQDIRVEEGTTRFRFLYRRGAGEDRQDQTEQSLHVTLSAMGEHNVRNALAALGIACELGLDMDNAAEALRSFKGQRLKVVPLSSCTMIDDTYNASPDSMKASLKVLAEMENVKGRRIAALSDMLELGDKERDYHYEVGEYIADLIEEGSKGEGGIHPIDEVVVYGDLAPEILRAIRDRTDTVLLRAFPDREALGEYLMERVKPDDVLLLKGSNGMKLAEIVKRFRMEEDREVKEGGL